MNKLEKLVHRLQASIDFATEQKEDFEASSWNYQEGVLLNHNEAKLVVNLVKKLTIPVVVGQSEQLVCSCGSIKVVTTGGSQCPNNRCSSAN